jgi:hypothetical protein
MFPALETGLEAHGGWKIIVTALIPAHVPGASFMYNSSLKLIWAALSSVEAPCFPFFPD